MNMLRNLFTGLITALGSTVVVIGALSLALTEGYTFAVPTTPPAPLEASATPLPGQTALPTRPSPTAQRLLVTATAPLATTCPAPQGWQPYMVQTGDTLESLAARYKTTAEELRQANCLVARSLLPGTILYLPPIPPTATATLIPSATPVPCGPPVGWVRYTVQPGDTLFKLSLALGVSVPQLQSANCLNSSVILVGQLLWVPFIPRPADTLTPIPPTAVTLPPTAITPVETTQIPTEIPSVTPETPTATTAVPTLTETPITPSPVVESGETSIPPSSTLPTGATATP